MTEQARYQRWRPLFGAAIACLLVAGCSSGTPLAGGDLAASTTTVAATTTTAGQVEATSEVGAALPLPDSIDAPALLATALAAYEGGYEFSSRAEVNGAEAVAADGRVVAGVSHMTLRSGDGEIEYLVAGPAQWARIPDGEWDLVAENSATPSPLALLAAPTGLTQVSVEGDVVVLEAVYPASAFGLAGETVVVTLTFTGGQLSEAGYAMEEGSARVVTSFRPLSDATPITVPPV